MSMANFADKISEFIEKELLVKIASKTVFAAVLATKTDHVQICCHFGNSYKRWEP